MKNTELKNNENENTNANTNTKQKEEATHRKTDILPKADVFTPEYFLHTCEGRCENGEARSEIGISLLLYMGDMDSFDKEAASNDLNYREVSTRLSKKGAIRFIQNKDQVIVDITFNTSLEPEFKLFWRQFEQYEEALRNLNKADEDGTPGRYPLLMFTVVPDAYADECYLTFLNPTFWVLQPKDAETEECSMIRMLIPADNFNIEGIPEEVNIKDLEAEAARTYNTILTEADPAKREV